MKPQHNKHGIRILVPKPRVRVRQCFKVRHETRADAFDHLVSYEERFHDYSLTVYRCKFCKAFHIGHAHKGA